MYHCSPDNIVQKLLKASIWNINQLISIPPSTTHCYLMTIQTWDPGQFLSYTQVWKYNPSTVFYQYVWFTNAVV